MTQNLQLEASTTSLETSEKYLAAANEQLMKALAALDISRDEKNQIDRIVKNIQHYTYRIALSNFSVQMAKTLQSVYIGCSDPTGSQTYWAWELDKSIKSAN